MRHISKQLYTRILQNGEYRTPWLHFYREVDDNDNEIVMCKDLYGTEELVTARTKGIEYE